MFIANSNSTVAVKKDDIKAMVVQGLLIVFKMDTGPDIVYEQAADEAELVELRTRTWNQLND